MNLFKRNFKVVNVYDGGKTCVTSYFYGKTRKEIEEIKEAAKENSWHVDYFKGGMVVVKK